MVEEGVGKKMWHWWQMTQAAGGVAGQQVEEDLSPSCKSEQREEGVGKETWNLWKMTQAGWKGVAGQQGEDDLTIK